MKPQLRIYDDKNKNSGRKIVCWLSGGGNREKKALQKPPPPAEREVSMVEPLCFYNHHKPGFGKVGFALQGRGKSQM